VSFIIDQVVLSKDTPVNEKLFSIGDIPISPAASRQVVRCIRHFPILGKFFMSVGQEIFIYALDNKHQDWTKIIYKIPLQSRAMDPRAGPAKDKEPVQVIDIAFSSTTDILCILRSDLCFEFFHFNSLSKLCRDTIIPAGTWPVDQSYDKFATKCIPRQTSLLFAVGKSKVVDLWSISLKLNGLVQLEEHEPMVKHTDYVRDILVIDTDLYRLVITAGMDRKVMIWDLETLAYKSRRRGHSAGVQCLAFDGRSLVLGGGFDFAILAWDLDAEIDRPLYRLIGHTAPLTRLVCFAQKNVCCSLDSHGELRYWTVGTTKQELVDVVNCNEDRFRSLELVPHLGPAFNTLHDLILIAGGRRKHVFKVIDTTPIESAPIVSFYSSALQTIIVVHMHHIRFWSAMSGQLLQNCETSGENFLATLDAREQKILVVDTKGAISTYNCLDGKQLSKLRPVPVNTSRFVFYSPDKCVICVTSQGEIFVVDEFPVEQDQDTFLRHVTMPEVEIIASAFSSSLGLLATLDVNGMLLIWNYQYLTLENVIENCYSFMNNNNNNGAAANAAGGGVNTSTASSSANAGVDVSVGQILFLDPFPVLLLADNVGGFTLVVVGAAAESKRDIVWRVKAVYDIPDNMESTGGGGGVSVGAEGGEGSPGSGEEDVDIDYLEGGQSTGALAKVFDAKKLMAFQRRRRAVKSVTLHVAQPTDGALHDFNWDMLSLDSSVIEVEDDSEGGDGASVRREGGIGFGETDTQSFRKSALQARQTVHMLNHKRAHPLLSRRFSSLSFLSASASSVFSASPMAEASKANSPVTNHGVSFTHPSPIAGDRSGLTSGVGSSAGGGLSSKHGSKGKLRSTRRDSELIGSVLDLHAAGFGGSFPADTYLTLVCGHDDGTIAVYDFTETLRKLDVAPVISTNTATDISSVQQVDEENSLGLEKGNQNHRMKSDHKLQHRHQVANNNGTNSRPKLNRNISLEDIQKVVNKRKNALARRRVSRCKLKVVWAPHNGAVTSLTFVGEKDYLLTTSDDSSVQLWSMQGQFLGILTRGSARDRLIRRHWKSPLDFELRQSRRNKMAASILTVLGDLDEEPVVIENRRTTGIRAVPSASDLVSLMSIGGGGGSRSTRAELEALPDRERAIGQLRGKITYIPSKQEIAELLVASKHEKALKRIHAIGKTKSKRSKRRERNRKASTSETSAAFVEADYFEKNALKLGGVTGLKSSKLHADDNIKENCKVAKKEEKFYLQSEMAAIQADDPDNWGISSTNTQRKMYKNLYYEKGKTGLDMDQTVAFQTRLNSLSPNGNFTAFVEMLNSGEFKRRYDSTLNSIASDEMNGGVMSTVTEPDILPFQNQEGRENHRLTHHLHRINSGLESDGGNGGSVDENRSVGSGSVASNSAPHNVTVKFKGTADVYNFGLFDPKQAIQHRELLAWSSSSNANYKTLPIRKPPVPKPQTAILPHPHQQEPQQHPTVSDDLSTSPSAAGDVMSHTSSQVPLPGIPPLASPPPPVRPPHQTSHSVNGTEKHHHAVATSGTQSNDVVHGPAGDRENGGGVDLDVLPLDGSVAPQKDSHPKELQKKGGMLSVDVDARGGQNEGLDRGNAVAKLSRENLASLNGNEGSTRRTAGGGSAVDVKHQMNATYPAQKTNSNKNGDGTDNRTSFVDKVSQRVPTFGASTDSPNAALKDTRKNRNTNHDFHDSESTHFNNSLSRQRAHPTKQEIIIGSLVALAEKNHRQTQAIVEKFDQNLEVALGGSATDIHYGENDMSHGHGHGHGHGHKEVSYSYTGRRITEKVRAEKTDTVPIAQVMLSRAKTLDGMLKIGKKQMQAEMAWVKKVRLSNSESDTKSGMKDMSSVKARVPSSLIVGFAAGKNRDQNQHKLTPGELLARNTFGPYKAADILKAVYVFISLGPANDEKDDVEVRDTITVKTTNSQVSSKSDTNSYQNQIANLALQQQQQQQHLPNTPSAFTSKKVLLADFIQTDFVQSRPHFDQELRKFMKRKTGRVGMVELRVTIHTIITNMCPLMSPKDLHDCLDYVNYHLKRQRTEMSVPVVEVLSEEQLSQLKTIFQFFDKGKTGRINRAEITRLIEAESARFYAKQQADFLEGGEMVDEDLNNHEAEDRVNKLFSVVDVKNPNELDFDEFVQLFKNVV